MNIYHHDIHKKKVTRSAITSLESPNRTLNGHKNFADFITQNVSDLFGNKFHFNESSHKILLNELDTVFTEEDNTMLMKKPTKS